MKTVNDGMVPRALFDIFSIDNDDNNSREISISFTEIYNEKIYDLLAGPNDISGAIKYTNCTKRKVSNLYEAQRVLQEGNKNRHVRPTKMNINSSRSHAIFTVNIETETVRSALNLVDLAGSEGVRRTGNQGAALTEGVNINKGLLSIGKVMQALSTGEKIIPYRDSILSFTLKDSLNLNSYLTLLACVSPLVVDGSETLATLRFAMSAKSSKYMPKINTTNSVSANFNLLLFNHLFHKLARHYVLSNVSGFCWFLIKSVKHNLLNDRLSIRFLYVQLFYTMDFHSDCQFLILLQVLATKKNGNALEIKESVGYK